MLVSLEALAMTGASDVECGMDIEEWERKDLEQYPPPHLLAEEEEEEDEGNSTGARWEYDKEEHRLTKLDTTIQKIWSHDT
ncbi:hypothetical protein CR513_62804, partial [Mucuna pruriens]